MPPRLFRMNRSASTTCLIGLGANLGPCEQTLARAVFLLGAVPGVRLLAQSRIRKTAPAGGPSNQPEYFNAAATIETSLEPEALLAQLQRIERELGRKHDGERWGPRPIDLDLLVYGDRVVETSSLTVPHRRMAWRRFVLEPAAEIAPEMVHPRTGWTLRRLLAHLNETPLYVAIAGPIGVGKTSVARAVAERLSARLALEQLDLDALAGFYGDPAAKAWDTELAFLEQRRRLLDAAAIDPREITVSDCWFDQSMAFASVWLEPDRLAEFRRHWEHSRRSVARPRLIVLLDAPDDELMRRIAARDRACERRLSPDRVAAIRRAIRSQAAEPDVGPVLRLTNNDLNATLVEILAAIEAMR